MGLLSGFELIGESSHEPHIVRARISGWDKMNNSDYQFTTVVGIDVAKKKIDIADNHGLLDTMRKRIPSTQTPSCCSVRSYSPRRKSLSRTNRSSSVDSCP